jgi:uncharacterized delta-60 repeat protein
MKSEFTIKAIFILLVGFLVFFQTVNGAPGNLDTTFSQDGKAFAAVGDKGSDGVSATAVQPDGKIITAGSAGYGSYINGIQRACALARYQPDGSLDTSFGDDGKVTIWIGVSFVCEAVAVQADGKIVAAGSTHRGADSDFALVRFKADGSLDTTFDADGKILTPVSGADDHLWALAIQPDGKIVALGTTYLIAAYENWISVVRYNADGSPDATFDGDGKVSIAGRAMAMALQSDGKIVLAGATLHETNPDFALWRLNADGSLDAAFDGDGQATTDFSSDSDAANAVTIQTDGKIIAAGTISNNARSDFAVARYNPDGSLDTTFENDGKVTTAFSSNLNYTSAVGVQADGKAVAVGYNINGESLFVRYKTDGTLDTEFDGDGKLTTSIMSGAKTLMFQTDGKIISAGGLLRNSNFDSVVVRLNPNGSFDTSFDTDGQVLTDIGVRNSGARAVAIQADGKIVTAGYSGTYTESDFGLARFNTDGSLDPTFDNDGMVTTTFPFNGSEEVTAIAIQPDGKIVAAGMVNRKYGLARYNPDGSLDTTFNGDGRVISTYTGMDGASAVAVQPDGKIVVGGVMIGGLYGDFALFRFNPDGSPDTTFDGDGIARTSVSETDDAVSAIIIQPDGKIVAAGTALNANSDFAVVRYNADGSLDTTFDNDGMVTTSVANRDIASSVSLQPDGKIVVAGYFDDVSERDFALVRYNADGSLDQTFDGDGKIKTDFDGDTDAAFGVTVQPDGKILAVGFSINEESLADSAVVRYNPDGSLDTSFVNEQNPPTVSGGKIRLDLVGAGDDLFYAVAIDSKGRAVIAGEANGLVSVARILTASAANAPFDFDGDRKSDVSIFRAGAGEWWINRSSTSLTSAVQFGISTDKIVPADFTGDGKTDIAVWRSATGEWFVLRSEDGSFYSIPFGTAGDVAAPADFDADGKADLAVFRPGSGTWYINKSAGGTDIISFGQAGDVPVVGDYDGDGAADITIFRPSNGSWWYLRSSDKQFRVFSFGVSTDKPVPGDYTGDGKADIAVFRPVTGEWFFQRSEDNSYYSVPFGANGDIPSPGDYDGDGKFDTAVFRPSGATWYINRSNAGLLITSFGLGSDKPVPSAFVP